MLNRVTAFLDVSGPLRAFESFSFWHLLLVAVSMSYVEGGVFLAVFHRMKVNFSIRFAIFIDFVKHSVLCGKTMVKGSLRVCVFST